MKVLAVDVGGTHVKILASGEKEKREIDSGPSMTAQEMVRSVNKLAQGWQYDVVSVMKDTSDLATGQSRATGVMRAIMRERVPATRIHLGVRTDPTLAASQVRVYVR